MHLERLSAMGLTPRLVSDGEQTETAKAAKAK